MPLLLQAEMDNRETNRISKLIKGAGFRLTATIEELDINAARTPGRCNHSAGNR